MAHCSVKLAAALEEAVSRDPKEPWVSDNRNLARRNSVFSCKKSSFLYKKITTTKIINPSKKLPKRVEAIGRLVTKEPLDLLWSLLDEELDKLPKNQKFKKILLIKTFVKLIDSAFFTSSSAASLQPRMSFGSRY